MRGGVYRIDLHAARIASSQRCFRRSVATTVLRNSMAAVIGPTPPGMGVIQPAACFRRL
jgi:hypothetical protein